MRRRSERAGPVAVVGRHAVVVRCRLAGRASAAAARRAHDPRHRRRRRCGHVPTPSSTRFSSWTSASAVARGSVCRGASTSSQLRTTALLEAARSLRSTEATSSRCRPPSSPYAEYRRAGRRALGRVWATTASSTELRRYGRFGSCHVLPCDNAQQHVQLVQLVSSITAAIVVDGDGALLHRAAGCHRHVARLLGCRSTQRRPTSVPMWRIRRLGGASIVVHFE